MEPAIFMEVSWHSMAGVAGFLAATILLWPGMPATGAAFISLTKVTQLLRLHKARRVELAHYCKDTDSGAIMAGWRGRQTVADLLHQRSGSTISTKTYLVLR
jgi:hypothetical protein